MQTYQPLQGTWTDEEFVAQWIAQQDERVDERTRQFQMVRSLVPYRPGDDFKYMNLGAGPGGLDELILERFPHARATLVDNSPLMLQHAAERLARFGPRVDAIRADLSNAPWLSSIDDKGPFELVVSTLALHGLRQRLRTLYPEVFRQLADNALLILLDYVRVEASAVQALVTWANTDPEGLLAPARGGSQMASVDEQLSWLRDAGVEPVECIWKDVRLALVCAFKGTVRIPATP